MAERAALAVALPRHYYVTVGTESVFAAARRVGHGDVAC